MRVVEIDRTLGVFTSVAVVDGKPVWLDRHLRRLTTSAAQLFGADLPASLGRDVRVAATQLQNHERVRIEVRPDGDGEGNVVQVRIACGARPGGSEPIELDIVEIPDWSYEHKWIDRAAMPPAGSLVVDAHGIVLETPIANVFAVCDGVLVTPQHDGRILPGVARAVLIERYDVRETALPVADILRAEEVFVTNALRGVVPVHRVGDHHLSTTELANRISAAWPSLCVPNDAQD